MLHVQSSVDDCIFLDDHNSLEHCIDQDNCCIEDYHSGLNRVPQSAFINR